MTLFEISQVITGCLGAIGFGILFNIRGKKLLFTAIGGFISWLIFVLLGIFIEGEPTRYIIVAALITLYSEAMAVFLKTPASVFTITSLIPLIPGSSLYYTMEYVLEKDMNMFFQKGTATLQYAASLAVGIIIGTALSKTIRQITNYLQKHS